MLVDERFGIESHMLAEEERFGIESCMLVDKSFGIESCMLVEERFDINIGFKKMLVLGEHINDSTRDVQNMPLVL